MRGDGIVVMMKEISLNKVHSWIKKLFRVKEKVLYNLGFRLGWIWLGCVDSDLDLDIVWSSWIGIEIYNI